MVGWFPSNYTQEEGDADDTLHTYAMAENVLDIVVALYSFTSTNDQELSFEKGDRLEILDRPPSDPEWYNCFFLRSMRMILMILTSFIQFPSCN